MHDTTVQVLSRTCNALQRIYAYYFYLIESYPIDLWTQLKEWGVFKYVRVEEQVPIKRQSVLSFEVLGKMY